MPHPTSADKRRVDSRLKTLTYFPPSSHSVHNFANLTISESFSQPHRKQNGHHASLLHPQRPRAHDPHVGQRHDPLPGRDRQAGDVLRTDAVHLAPARHRRRRRHIRRRGPVAPRRAPPRRAEPSLRRLRVHRDGSARLPLQDRAVPFPHAVFLGERWGGVHVEADERHRIRVVPLQDPSRDRAARAGDGDGRVLPGPAQVLPGHRADDARHRRRRAHVPHHGEAAAGPRHRREHEDPAPGRGRHC